MTHVRTPDRDDRLRKLWAEGTTLPDIAAEFGMNKTTLTNYRRSLGLADRRIVGASTGEWTEDQKADVKKRWLAGESASEIARNHPGRTRNGVIGIIHRSGWQHNGRAAPAKPARAPTVARAHVRPPKPGPQNKPGAVFGVLTQHASTATAETREKKAAEGRAAIARTEQVTVASPNARPFLQAKGGCKWPIGDGLAMLFCCNPRVRGSYCEGHGAVAFSQFQPPARERGDRAADRLTKHDRVRAAPRRKAANDSLWDDAREAA